MVVPQTRSMVTASGGGVPSSMITLPERNTGRFCISPNGISLLSGRSWNGLLRLLLFRVSARSVSGRPPPVLPPGYRFPADAGAGAIGRMPNAGIPVSVERGRPVKRIVEGYYCTYIGRPSRSVSIIP